MKTIHQIKDIELRIKDNGGINAVSEATDITKQMIMNIRDGNGNPTKDVINRLRAFFGLVKLR